MAKMGKDTEMDMKAGAFIKQMRELAGLSQEALASRLGVSQPQVVKYEKGIDSLTIGWIRKFADALEPEMGQDSSWFCSMLWMRALPEPQRSVYAA